jgi:cytochrome c oxidase assembly protein subunit 15
VTHRLSRFAWFVLIYNALVVLWGAYVRATGSGAGCGQHWPLCNGEVVPASPSTAMVIEFSHRVSSGLALVLVGVLAIWVWRTCRAGHPARRGAVLSVIFILTEAIVGAGLVLFQLVADNATMARAMFMAVHLVNTFALLACLALTAYWVSGGSDIRLKRGGSLAWMIGAALLGLVAVGKSGAVAALGDTLYPPSSLNAGMMADLSATSAILIRLRVLHPVIAIVVGVALIVWSARVGFPAGSRVGPAARRALYALVVAQLAAGLLNVLMLAPVWMQLVHLLLADAVWVALVLMAASALADERPAARAH